MGHTAQDQAEKDSMYGNPSKSHAAAQRSAERRKREDEAPRLSAEVPALTNVRIEVVEHVPNGTTKHVKLIVVARAPALFVIACGDHTCQDGGHDITHEMMAGLRSHRSQFGGESACGGMTGSAPCARTIEYRVSAEYSSPSPRRF
jgi:hypothetical protein